MAQTRRIPEPRRSAVDRSPASNVPRIVLLDVRDLEDIIAHHLRNHLLRLEAIEAAVASPPKPKPFLDSAEVQALTGASETTLAAWRREGMPYYKIEGVRGYSYVYDEVVTWVKARAVRIQEGGKG